MNTKNAQEVIREAYERGYSGRLARSHKGDAIAYWTGERWAMCAALTIAGQWVGMEAEILVNGTHVVQQDQWTEQDPPNILAEIHATADAFGSSTATL